MATDFKDLKNDKREKKDSSGKMRAHDEFETLQLILAEHSWLKNRVLRHIEKHLRKKPKIS